jgi:hypothetical protein
MVSLLYFNVSKSAVPRLSVFIIPFFRRFHTKRTKVLVKEHVSSRNTSENTQNQNLEVLKLSPEPDPLLRFSKTWKIMFVPILERLQLAFKSKVPGNRPNPTVQIFPPEYIETYAFKIGFAPERLPVPVPVTVDIGPKGGYGWDASKIFYCESRKSSI